MATIFRSAPALVIATLLFTISAFVNHAAPQPYMDELFHIPQAQRFCNGIFDWDPKITTPPGLYLISAFIARCISTLTPSFLASPDTVISFWCSPQMLRVTNIVMGATTTTVLSTLIRDISPVSPKSSHLRHISPDLSALIISTFPVAFFFHLVYYTDSGSTLFILLAYDLSMRDQLIASSIACAIAILFRQTNVVWMLFIAATVAIRESARVYPTNTLDCVACRVGGVGHFLQIIGQFISRIVYKLHHFIGLLWPYIIVALSFIVFVIVNGGIVLGDKENHKPSIHVPQLYYFSGFTAVFAFFPARVYESVWVFVRSGGTILHSPKMVIMLGLIAIVMAETIRRYTIEHPFLLSDNRHYTFYIWKNIYKKHTTTRYAMIPLYMISMWSISRRLASRKTMLWITAFFVCVVMTLVPSPLVEFRYFVIPFVVIRVHLCRDGVMETEGVDETVASEIESWVMVVGELCVNVGVVVGTVWLFVARPFMWENEPGVLQRFMW